MSNCPLSEYIVTDMGILLDLARKKLRKKLLKKRVINGPKLQKLAQQNKETNSMDKE